jgi:conjugal transfer ATP-binding protein TraC
MSLNSPFRINPFDLPKKRDDQEDFEGLLRSNIATLIGLLHLMLGSVTPEEDSILDQALRETYAVRDITGRTDLATLTPSSFPTMTDLYEVLRNMEGTESLAARLEKYTQGNFFGDF